MHLTAAGDRLIVDREQYQHWIATVEPALVAARIDEAWRQCAQLTPTISVLMPTYNSDADFLRAALDSVLAQHYPHWQLCIVDDASTQPHVRPLLEQYAQQDSRIRLSFQTGNRGIAATSNRALAAATGDYIALLDHDDVLPPHALLSVAAAINLDPDAEILFSDSDSLDVEGQRIEPFCKPGWNYDLLLGQNYVNHLTVYRTQQVHMTGGWREGFEGSQDYDLLLRVGEGLRDSQIHHIQEILYHWRQVPTSVSRANLGAAVRAARSAIREHLQRRGQQAAVKPCGGAVLYNRIEWQAPAAAVAIAIYGDDEAGIERTRREWMQLMPTLDVHGVLQDKGAFQPLNAWAARQSAAYIGFIAAGFAPLSPDEWDALLGHIGRAAVAAVSAKLVRADGSPRGPLVMSASAAGDAVFTASCRAAHSPANSGYVASLLLDRQVCALQAGCMLVKTAAFRGCGGWNSPLSDSLKAGVDLSLRLRAGDHCLVWSSQAVARSDSSALDATLAADEVRIDLALAVNHIRRDDNFNKNLAP
jgi:O-antigen biosynthesis protein